MGKRLGVHWAMKELGAIFALVWLIAFLAAPKLGAGWGWDSANALGLAAFVGMLYLSLPGQPRRDVHLHERLGYAVLTLLLAHALWFILFDAAAVEYIKPDAPAYMWTGIASLLIVVALIVLARMPRRKNAHSTYGAFRYLHLSLSIVAMCLAAHHVVVSGLYLRTYIQVAALIALLGIAVVARPIAVSRHETVSPPAFLVLSAVAVRCFRPR